MTAPIYTSVSNPQWANAEHTLINCDVNFSHLAEEVVPFTASPLDSMEYGVQIYNECVAGNYGDIAEYVAPEIAPPSEPTKAELLAQLQELTAKIEALGA